MRSQSKCVLGSRRGECGRRRNQQLPGSGGLRDVGALWHLGNWEPHRGAGFPKMVLRASSIEAYMYVEPGLDKYPRTIRLIALSSPAFNLHDGRDS